MRNLAGWDPQGAAPLPDIPEKDTLLPDLSGEYISQTGTPGRDTVTIGDAGVPLTGIISTGEPGPLVSALFFAKRGM